MSDLEQWTRRPTEEANLFNPSFLCALMHEYLKEFSKDNNEGASIFLITLALAIVLHRSSRDRLPYSTVTPIYAWIQQNEDLLVGFAPRAKNIGPYVREAAMFGLASTTLQSSKGWFFLPGEKKALFGKTFIEETTIEMKNIIERTRFVGRWMAKSGSEVSIAAALGVRP